MHRWFFVGPVGPLAFGRNAFDFLFWLLILALPFLLLFILFDRLFSGDGYSGNSRSPVEILKRRFANGEITKQEFDEKIHDLHHMAGKEENMT